MFAIIVGVVTAPASWPLTYFMGYPVRVEDGTGRFVGIPFFIAYFDPQGRDYVGLITMIGVVLNGIFWFLFPQVILWISSLRSKWSTSPYTPALREVVKLSKAEAGRLGQAYVGPEHYLLGIIRKGDGAAIQVLVTLKVDLFLLKSEIERRMESAKPSPVDSYGTNESALNVLKEVDGERHHLGHNHLGTEHLLLALTRSGKTIPAECLANVGVTYEKAHYEILNIFNRSGEP